MYPFPVQSAIRESSYRGNNIRRVEPGAFHGAGLFGTKYATGLSYGVLDLSFNAIEGLDAGAFHGMGHVTEDPEFRPGIKGAGTCWRITLAHNRIAYVEAGAFEAQPMVGPDYYDEGDYYGLEGNGEACHSFLDLSDNELREWDAIELTDMRQVDILNLRRNRLAGVMPSSFLAGFHFLDYLFVDGNSDLAGFESLSALVPAAADTTFGGGDEDDAGGKPVEYRGYVYTSGTLAAGCPGMDLGRVVCHSSYCDTEEVWRIANDWCDCGPGAGVARAAGGSALLLFVHFEDESPADADLTAPCE